MTPASVLPQSTNVIAAPAATEQASPQAPVAQTTKQIDSFPIYLRAERAAFRLSQEAFAQAIGVEPGTYKMWERARAKPMHREKVVAAIRKLHQTREGATSSAVLAREAARMVTHTPEPESPPPAAPVLEAAAPLPAGTVSMAAPQAPAADNVIAPLSPDKLAWD